MIRAHRRMERKKKYRSVDTKTETKDISHQPQSYNIVTQNTRAQEAETLADDWTKLKRKKGEKERERARDYKLGLSF